MQWDKLITSILLGEKGNKWIDAHTLNSLHDAYPHLYHSNLLHKHKLSSVLHDLPKRNTLYPFVYDEDCIESLYIYTYLTGNVTTLLRPAYRETMHVCQITDNIIVILDVCTFCQTPTEDIIHRLVGPFIHHCCMKCFIKLFADE